MPVNALKCIVKGRVQGVFYRASTVEQANLLGVNGWVRNLSDGRVELVVSGEAAAVDRLVAWLWRGPPQALVEAVTLEEWTANVEPGFSAVR
jgi:acylphosphatase